MNEKPPSLINGKPNPAYHRWWRKNNPGKHAQYFKTYRAKHLERLRLNARMNEAKKRAQLVEQGKMLRRGETRCTQCGLSFKRSDVSEGGGLLFNFGWKCVCHHCRPPDAPMTAGVSRRALAGVKNWRNFVDASLGDGADLPSDYADFGNARQ